MERISAFKKERNMKEVTDHKLMKINNQLIILRSIRELGPISRKKLQEETKLSWGTITATIKEFIGRGIIKEIGTTNTGVGRRPVELDVNKEKNFAIGLRLGGAFIKSVLMDVKGNVVKDLKIPVDSQKTKGAILNQLFEAFENILEKASVTIEEIAGIGVAAPGAIDTDSGICLYAPHHPNWKNVPLKKIFEKKYKVPFFVDHVNNCSALGERWFGFGKDIDNFLCVLLGTGISAGIIINGEVYRGIDYTAGEFGHTCIDPAGPKCVCGQNGCLEVYASGLALSKHGIEAAKKNRTSKILTLADGKAENISGETLFLAAQEGDKDALIIFEEMGRLLGIGVSNLINLFNPECVILCGEVSIASEFFLPSMEKTIKQKAWHFSRKDIRISRLGDSAVLGAAGIVLQEIYNKGLLFNKRLNLKKELSQAANNSLGS